MQSRISEATNFALTLTVAIRDRDSDALHSLIEGRSEDESFVRRFKKLYPKIAALLTPDDEEWFRLQLGGCDETRQTSSSVACRKLILLSQVADIVGVDYFSVRRFLIKSPYQVFLLWKGDRVVAEAIAPTDLVRVSLDLVVFLVRERILAKK